MERFLNASIILPVVNEDNSLIETVKIICDECNSSDVAEFILITCEKTTKASLKAIETLKETFFSMSFNDFSQKESGLSCAVIEGIEKARGSHLVIMASDMDTDPHLVHEFIEKAKANSQAVIYASRWCKGGGFVGYSKSKKLLNYFAQRFVSIFFEKKISDYTYGYKLAPTNALKKLNLTKQGNTVGFESTIKLLKSGYDFIEIPAVWKNRESGNSNFKSVSYKNYLKTLFSAIHK